MHRSPEQRARTRQRWHCRRHLKRIACDSAARHAADVQQALCVWLDVAAASDELPPGAPAEARAVLRSEVDLWQQRLNR